jgi:hypothetical protein
MRFLVAGSVAGGVLFLSGAAFAQSGQDLALAETLFRDGKAAMEQKKYDQACPKFAESYRLDPQVGTLLNLANCHEAWGKTASAWGEFNDVHDRALKANQAERAEFAKQHAAALGTKLSKVKLVAPRPAPAGLAVKVDGKPVSEVVLGSEAPMDPGAHQLEVSAPGKKTSTTTFNVAAGPSSASVDMPELADEAKGEPAGPALSVNGQPADGSAKRTTGFVIGGLGVAGVAVGAIFGVMYLGKQSDYNGCTKVNGFCDGDATKDADQKSSAETVGWISTIGFGVGIVGLAAGTYLILTSKSSSQEKASALRVAPAVGQRGGGLSLQGTF